jgi:hypothetical protein
MAEGWHNRFKYNLGKKLIDLSADTIKCMLLTSSHSFEKDHNTKSQIVANEVSGSGYTAGGAALGSKTVTQDDTNDRMAFDAADTTWASPTSVTAHYAVLYADDMASDELIACFEFGANYTSTAGEFKITWNASGILTLT